MSSAAGMEARHIRGLVEKIWNVFAPRSAALRAAFSRDWEMEVWIPRRRVLILSDSEWRRPTGMAFQLLYFIPSGGERMLWTIFVILLVLWLLGLVTSYTL